MKNYLSLWKYNNNAQVSAVDDPGLTRCSLQANDHVFNKAEEVCFTIKLGNGSPNVYFEVIKGEGRHQTDLGR